MTDTTILQGVVGSTAYGLAREGSDLDVYGVFVTPASVIAGWDWTLHDETRTTAGPHGDDYTEHEVRKFVRLACKANPTISELLWLGEYDYQDEWGFELVGMREAFLSRKYVMSAYSGYARAQINKFGTSSKTKHARHTLRLIEQGIGLLRTGELSVKVENPQRYFDFDDMETGAILEVLTTAFKEFDEVESSVLPELPDLDSAADFIASVRNEFS